MIELLILVFGTVVYTGPACEDIRTRRKQRRDYPKARIAERITSMSDSRLKYKPPQLRKRTRDWYNW